MIKKLKNASPFIKSLGYWAFVVVFGLLLFYLDKVDDIEPFFTLSALVYWSLLVYWAARWVFKQIRSVLSLGKEKKRIELLHLQSQVNPHFFFNTLNNLYGLVDKDSDKAKQLILKLSDMMRYSIYDGQKERITLEQEVEYIDNYIELHKMRYHKEIKVTLNTEITEAGYTLMPLLFIMLVENAFKHGVEKLRKDAFINLNISNGNGKIHFSIVNNFDKQQVKLSESGIGLDNLKRRLAIGYPKKHDLSIKTSGDIFEAQLSLNTK